MFKKTRKRFFNPKRGYYVITKYMFFGITFRTTYKQIKF